MSAAEKSATDLHAMTDYFAVAVFTNRRNCLNCTFEAVERMPRPSGDQLQSLVVVIATNFAFRHFAPQKLSRSIFIAQSCARSKQRRVLTAPASQHFARLEIHPQGPRHLCSRVAEAFAPNWRLIPHWVTCSTQRSAES